MKKTEDHQESKETGGSLTEGFPVPEALQYFNLPRGIFSEVGAEYEAFRTSRGRGPWIQINRVEDLTAENWRLIDERETRRDLARAKYGLKKASEMQLGSGIKFHIPADPLDPHNLAQAWEITVSLMREYKIPRAKVIMDGRFFDKARMVGRPIVVYAGSSPDAVKLTTWLPFLIELHIRLVRAGVKVGVPPYRDRNFGGSPFLYYRNDLAADGIGYEKRSEADVTAETGLDYNPAGLPDPFGEVADTVDLRLTDAEKARVGYEERLTPQQYLVRVQEWKAEAAAGRVAATPPPVAARGDESGASVDISAALQGEIKREAQAEKKEADESSGPTPR